MESDVGATAVDATEVSAVSNSSQCDRHTKETTGRREKENFQEQKEGKAPRVALSPPRVPKTTKAAEVEVVQRPERTTSRRAVLAPSLSDNVVRVLFDDEDNDVDYGNEIDYDKLALEVQSEYRGTGQRAPDPSRVVGWGLPGGSQAEGGSGMKWEHREEKRRDGGEWDGWELRRAEEGGQ